MGGDGGRDDGRKIDGVSVELVNGAPSELPREVGTPAALVARDVLQNAHNLGEAAAIF